MRRRSMSCGGEHELCAIVAAALVAAFLISTRLSIQSTLAALWLLRLRPRFFYPLRSWRILRALNLGEESKVRMILSRTRVGGH